jgi:hypothetical protein
MTAETTRSRPSAGQWLLGPAKDSALIIATPLLILPLAWVFQNVWSDGALILLVGAFGQLGHCLPGLIRAYGDHDLYQRYRARFIVAPVAIGIACLVAARWNMDVLVLVGVTWAIWHAPMQTYGFLRIYDARAGLHSKIIRYLEFSLCVLWFGGALLLNDRPLSLMLSRWYGAGGFLLPAPFVSAVRGIWLAALAAVSLAYMVALVRCWRRGTPVPLPAVLVLISSAGFYWFAYAGATNILVGAALFEIFHDVQYLTIVWLFNRRRVEEDASVGGLVRFVFRRSGALVGVCIALVFSFGGLRLVEGMLPVGVTREVLTAALVMAGLLHYYYDGFIWKVSDPSTRTSLGIRNTPQRSRRINVPGWLHALKWTVALIPVLWLTCAEAIVQPNETARWMLVHRSLPHFEPLSTHLHVTIGLANRQPGGHGLIVR